MIIRLEKSYITYRVFNKLGENSIASPNVAHGCFMKHVNLNSKLKGHLLATITILIWGLTFVFSKMVLEEISSLTLMILRFGIGTIVTFIIYPHFEKIRSWKHEAMYALAGLFGVVIYFILECAALERTYASNVSLIVCVAPMFTALGCAIFYKEEKLTRNFAIGFVVALIGIGLISFNGTQLQLNPAGDLLAVLAALAWSVYCVIMKKMEAQNYPVIVSTRKTFLYSMAFLFMCIPFMDFTLNIEVLKQPRIWGSVLYLGVLASAICYVMWNTAVQNLGVISTSAYIYGQPVVAIIAGILLLGEKMTAVSGIGAFLTIGGLILSQIKPTQKPEKVHINW